MGPRVATWTHLGTLSAGLRTGHTARGKHARVGTGRTMPGTLRSALASLQYTQPCDIVSRLTGSG